MSEKLCMMLQRLRAGTRTVSPWMIRDRAGFGSGKRRRRMWNLAAPGCVCEGRRQNGKQPASQKLIYLIPAGFLRQDGSWFRLSRGRMVLAGSRKSRRFWVWLGVVAAVIVVVAGVALARL